MRRTKADLESELRTAYESRDEWRREANASQRTIDRLTEELACEKRETERLRSLLASADSKETATINTEFPDGGSLQLDGPARLVAPIAAGLSEGFAQALRSTLKRND